MSSEKKGMLAASCAYFIFGLSYLFSKRALEVTPTMILLALRFTVTFVVLNALVLTGVMKLKLKGKNLLGPILLGIVQPVIYFILENYGLDNTTTSFTGIISSISPIFTAILGAVFLKERPNLKQWICIGVSIVGVMMVSIGATGGQNTVAGCLSLLAAYVSGSVYSLLVRKLSKDFSPFELTYIMFIVGFVFFAVIAFVQFGGQTISLFASALHEKDVLIGILYLGAVASVGAYMLANYSLARLPVARSTIFGNLSTVVSVLAGLVIMKDPFEPIIIVSFVLILFGVWGVNAFANRQEDR